MRLTPAAGELAARGAAGDAINSGASGTNSSGLGGTVSGGAGGVLAKGMVLQDYLDEMERVGYDSARQKKITWARFVQLFYEGRKQLFPNTNDSSTAQ